MKKATTLTLLSAVLVVLFVLAAVPSPARAVRAAEPTPDKNGWYDLFDGKSLDDWKAAEDLKAFKVEDGLIVAGPSKLTHLYYNGPVQKAVFKDFELKAEVKTRPKGNSGIFFHTQYQAKGIPAGGSSSRSTTPGATRNTGPVPSTPRNPWRKSSSRMRSGSSATFWFAGARLF
jgi:hypothetical protein